MARVVVGTSDGVCAVDPATGAVSRSLEGHDVRALAPEVWTRLWAIVDRREIWRGEGDASAWERVASLGSVPGGDALEAHCLADTRANQEGGVLVGTSQARLFRVGADLRVSQLDGFERAPDRAEWYTPWGGPADTRSITEDGGGVFVNVHVGGVLRSRDEGATWQPTIDIHADVHRVVTGAGRVYAAGATGLSISDDGGDSWRLSASGLHATYCRSVAVCGSAVLLSASTGPGGRHSALYRSGLDAAEFERCREGLPEWFDGNVDSLCLDALPDGRLATFGTHDGDVYASRDEGVSWSRVAARIGRISCVLVLP